MRRNEGEAQSRYADTPAASGPCPGPGLPCPGAAAAQWGRFCWLTRHARPMQVCIQCDVRVVPHSGCDSQPWLAVVCIHVSLICHGPLKKCSYKSSLGELRGDKTAPRSCCGGQKRRQRQTRGLHTLSTVMHGDPDQCPQLEDFQEGPWTILSWSLFLAVLCTLELDSTGCLIVRDAKKQQTSVEDYDSSQTLLMRSSMPKCERGRSLSWPGIEQHLICVCHTHTHARARALLAAVLVLALTNDHGLVPTPAETNRSIRHASTAPTSSPVRASKSDLRPAERVSWRLRRPCL